MSPHITPGILKETRGRESHRRRSVSFDLGSSAGGQGSITQGGGAVMSLLTTRIKDQQKVSFFIVLCILIMHTQTKPANLLNE